MPADVPNPDPQQLAQLFALVPSPGPGVFEIGLVLGGTVSAGAYTAGALDFLFEALDAWTAATRAGGFTGPSHEVRIKVITGTSGGGVCAAIAARALNYKFPPMAISSEPPETVIPGIGTVTGNPFYDVWCRLLSFDAMLAIDDLKTGVIPSVLNGGVIDRAASYIETFKSGTTSPREYLGSVTDGEPLRVILTMTNLHGIPYKILFPGIAGTQGETFVDHADFVRYAVAYPFAAGATFEFRPDESVLSFESARYPQAATWSDFSLSARATSAFPLGFPARTITRRVADYAYRAVLVQGEDQASSSWRVLTPDWDQLRGDDGTLPANHVFQAVDGGATDNEPIEMARIALCGLAGRNPRGGDKASRCVLLIDPFSGETSMSEPTPGLVSIAGGTLNALLQQTRYDTSDLVLAVDPDIFSRFMISANRDGIIGSKALATAGLGAFIGFACPAFARHDFMLGRQNCQRMLLETFGLPTTNPIVSPWYSTATAADKAAHTFQLNGQTMVRLIPLCGDTAVIETTEPWPVGKLDPENFRDLIETRWKMLLNGELPNEWWKPFTGWLGGLVSEGKVADTVIGKMNDALGEWRLLSPSA
jgi:hypothetical protein